MFVVCTDTSCVLAIAFEEPGSSAIKERLSQYDVVAASNLLEAEVSSALVREHRMLPDRFFAKIRWNIPDRRLEPEIERVASVGYLRGADVWHLACALYLVPNPSEGLFLTLDARQRDVAERLGFQI